MPDLQKLRCDTIAGCTVAVIAIPQAIAYAIVANVPPVYGVYTLVIQGLLGAILNTNRLMAVGPVNTHSLLVASILSHVLRDDAATAADRGVLFVQMAAGLSLLKGAIQLGMSAGRLGNIARYFSQSVVVGFTSGAGVLIAFNQVPAWLGVNGEPKSQLGGIWGTLIDVGPQMSAISIPSVLLGTCAMVVIIICNRLAKSMKEQPAADSVKRPNFVYRRVLPVFLSSASLVAVLLGSIMVAVTGWSVSHIETMAVSWPEPRLPDLNWRQYERLLGGAFALSLLGLLETYSISRAIATDRNVAVDANRELASQGWIHAISGFFQCFPGSGSLSRSAVNVQTGAVSRASGAICAIVVAIVFTVGGSWADRIPLASIAGLLILVGIKLIDLRTIRQILRTNRLDAYTCIFTFVATISIPLHYAIFAGVLVNLAMFIQRTSQLHLVEMISEGDEYFFEVPLNKDAEEKEILFLQLEGELFFGVADELREQLSTITAPKVVVLRLKRTRSIDTSILRVLSHFTRGTQARGGHVVVCGLRDELLEQMSRYGLVSLIGKDNVFPVTTTIFGSAKKALARAEELNTT